MMAMAVQRIYKNAQVGGPAGLHTGSRGEGSMMQHRCSYSFSSSHGVGVAQRVCALSAGPVPAPRTQCCGNPLMCRNGPAQGTPLMRRREPLSMGMVRVARAGGYTGSNGA